MDSRLQELSLVLALLAATGFLVPTGAVAFLPAVLLFCAELVRAFRCWVSGWLYLRRTTPEERILENERR